MINHRTGFGTNWMVLFAPLMATVAVSAQAAQNGFQFDIICPVHGRVLVDPVAYRANMNLEPGYGGPSEWRITFRYAIDLKLRRFTERDSVKPELSKIVRGTPSRIWFSEDAEGFERYNLRTNRYLARGKVGNWLIENDTALCRRAPFSGFPVLPRTVGNK